MDLVITIDTEEDNWGQYHNDAFTTKNIERIPFLQEIFDKHGITPTYLITYPVASDGTSIGILKSIVSGGRCEIGAHPHSWNTPPFLEDREEKTSFINNLPPNLQYLKIRTLTERIMENFGTRPTSYRSGRWGFGREVARNLRKLGYRVDSSMTPFTDWRDYGGPDFSDVEPGIWAIPAEQGEGGFGENPNGDIIEVTPTIGFLQRDFRRSQRLRKAISRSFLSHLSLLGAMNRLRLLNLVWLSPEMSGSPEMISLARRMMSSGHTILNFFFHSTSLLEGTTPFVNTKEEAKEFMRRIEEFSRFAKGEGFRPMTLSEVYGRIPSAGK